MAKIVKVIEGLLVYENTEENGWEIGWLRFPEYCVGDQKAKYVVHDHKAGLFFFVEKLR